MNTLNSAMNNFIAARTITYNNLTTSQKPKYAHFSGIYHDEAVALQLSTPIEPRGENSWKIVNEKIDAIDRGDYQQQQYDDTCYDNFEIGNCYTSDDIIRIIGAVRRDMQLPAYLSSLRKNCERDFFRLFIVKTIYNEPQNETEDQFDKRRRDIVGYSPVFKLKPEE